MHSPVIFCRVLCAMLRVVFSESDCNKSSMPGLPNCIGGFAQFVRLKGKTEIGAFYNNGYETTRAWTYPPWNVFHLFENNPIRVRWVCSITALSLTVFKIFRRCACSGSGGGFVTEIKIFNVLLVKDFFIHKKVVPVPFFLFWNLFLYFMLNRHQYGWCANCMKMIKWACKHMQTPPWFSG